MAKGSLNSPEKAEDESGDAPTSTSPVENAWAIKLPEFKKGDMKHSLHEESSFSVLFPKYREKYLRECWHVVQTSLQEFDIIADLDILEGRMIVRTTRKTWDPYSILKARDLIILIGRSVPVEHAVKVLKDDFTQEIIKIRGLVRNKDRFVKRRQRLIGSNGTTLKALELLTNCYVLIQGGTVAAIGPYKGVQQVVRVVQDTMKNIHPIYLLKALMIKKQLSTDENLKNEDWSKYIPNFTSKNVQRKKPKIGKVKKPYTPFPPEQPGRKIDAEIAAGQYHINEDNKKKEGDEKRRNNKKANKSDKQTVKENQRKKRAAAFIAPIEDTSSTTNVPSEIDIEHIKKKIKQR